MANEKLVALLEEGALQWNEWRKHRRDELVDLSNINLSNAYLNGVNLSRANLNGANLNGANLNGANLSNAELSNAYLSSTELNGADLSNAYLSGANLHYAQLHSADLRSADLRSADLRSANLGSANLSNTNLSNTNLRYAKISNANLGRTNLHNANLSGTDLSNADLRYANLSGVNLSNADLSNTDLSNTYLFATTIDSVDLRTVRGLSTIVHDGPSIVALHTIQLPEDGSASLFLRGCGVSNEWIDDYRARMMHPIQYYSVFLSYSTQDDLLAKRLHADLQDHGVRCWFAPHNLVPGDFFQEKIDQAIQQQDRLLLILSEHSVHSKWVKYEVKRALNREVHQERTILFPIRIDDTIEHSHSEWAKDLRNQRHIGDFTRWSEPERYQDQLKALLTYLKPRPA